MLQELYVTAVKKLRIEPVVARRALDLLCGIETVAVTFETIRCAAECSIRNRVSLCDALIVQAAIAGDCWTLGSEDLRAGQRIDGVRGAGSVTSNAHRCAARRASRGPTCTVRYY